MYTKTMANAFFTFLLDLFSLLLFTLDDGSPSAAVTTVTWKLVHLGTGSDTSKEFIFTELINVLHLSDQIYFVVLAQAYGVVSALPLTLGQI